MRDVRSVYRVRRRANTSAVRGSIHPGTGRPDTEHPVAEVFSSARQVSGEALDRTSNPSRWDTVRHKSFLERSKIQLRVHVFSSSTRWDSTAVAAPECDT